MSAPDKVIPLYRKTTMDMVLQVAEVYPVFPCRPKEEVVNGEPKTAKSPLVAGGFKAAKDKPAAVSHWWHQWPDALVGVPTGRRSGIIAVDIDPAGLAWYEAHKNKFPPTQINRTHRGMHLLFHDPLTDDVNSNQNTIADGIDVRGDGGYVIWWPAHGFPVENAGVIAEMPEWLLDLIKAPDPVPANDDPFANLPQGRTQHTAYDVALVLDKLDPDMGNDQWVKVGMGVRHQLGDAGFPIYDGFSSRARKKGKYLGMAHVRKRWDSFDDEGGVTFRTVLAMVKDLEPKKKTMIQFRHLSEIVAERREPEWLLLDVLEANVLAVMVGPRGSFKSFIAFDWAMRAAMAGEGVVILSGEGAGLDRRADAWMRTYGQGRELADLPIKAYEGILRLTQGEILEELAASLAGLDFKPRLLEIDTLSKYSPGLNENDNAEMAEFLSDLALALRDAFKLTVLLVAHTGHANQNRIRGAYTLAANPDAEYVVERKDPVGMEVTVTRERFKDTPSLPPLRYMASTVNLERNDKYGRPISSLVVELDNEPQAVADRKAVLKVGRNQRIVLQAIQDCLSPEGVAKEDDVIDKAIPGIPGNMPKKYAKQSLNGLEKTNTIVWDKMKGTIRLLP